MDYQQAWTFLDNLQFFKIKLGLAAMEKFLSRVGNPHHQLRYIHIGGTNGKGSVGATLLSILDRAGYKVGFYTSPHLSSVRERFRIGNTYISRKEFAELATIIRNALGKDQITYFEFTTTLALLWFARRQTDLVILEVGMGGRLDATNVITPLVSVITNVSMDHEQYLGNTLAEVAGEKAGIIKPGVPVVSGAEAKDAQKVIEQRCLELNSPLYVVGRDFSGKKDNEHWQYTNPDGERTEQLVLAMKGGYQVTNASLALTVLHLLVPHGFSISPDSIREGLARTRWPGRLELLQLQCGDKTCRYLLDGAHNPAGVEALSLALDEEFSYERLILIWGAMADKDIGSTLQTIAPLAQTIIFTRPESERSATAEELLGTLPWELRKKALLEENVAKALELAGQPARENDLICIAGSLYLVGRARQLLLGELV